MNSQSAATETVHSRFTIHALLAVNAVLLAAILWVLRGEVSAPSSAAAQSAQAARDYANDGVSNVGPRQRQTMLDGIVSLAERLAAIEKLLREQPLRVEVVVDEDR
ncbi:MAG: hypothetical protein ACO3EP_10425 [Phycisphaerales bacterium]